VCERGIRRGQGVGALIYGADPRRHDLWHRPSAP
jgi:hypothetical protein